MGRDEYITLIPISTRAVPGKASFRAVNIYYCNPLHTLWPIVEVLPPAAFEIRGEAVKPPIEVLPRR